MWISHICKTNEQSTKLLHCNQFSKVTAAHEYHGNHCNLEINRYACQQFTSANKDTETWNKLTVEEFIAFLGILIGMGLKGVSSLHDCWSQDWVLGIPSLACVMPVARFRDIFKYLHLNDNDKMSPRDNPDFDKLFKVRPLVDSLKANFKLQYKPHEVLSVDEAMIRFKGRTSLVQYMPIKRYQNVVSC